MKRFGSLQARAAFYLLCCVLFLYACHGADVRTQPGGGSQSTDAVGGLGRPPHVSAMNKSPEEAAAGDDGIEPHWGPIDVSPETLLRIKIGQTWREVALILGGWSVSDNGIFQEITVGKSEAFVLVFGVSGQEPVDQKSDRSDLKLMAVLKVIDRRKSDWVNNSFFVLPESVYRTPLRSFDVLERLMRGEGI